MKELTVHTHYDMLHSPKRNHPFLSNAMIAVSIVFFGCGMLLGRMSDNSIGQNTTNAMVMSGERVIPTNITRCDDRREEKNGTKLAWMVSVYYQASPSRIVSLVVASIYHMRHKFSLTLHIIYISFHSPTAAQASPVN